MDYHFHANVTRQHGTWRFLQTVDVSQTISNYYRLSGCRFNDDNECSAITSHHTQTNTTPERWTKGTRLDRGSRRVSKYRYLRGSWRVHNRMKCRRSSLPTNSWWKLQYVNKLSSWVKWWPRSTLTAPTNVMRLAWTARNERMLSRKKTWKELGVREYAGRTRLVKRRSFLV